MERGGCVYIMTNQHHTTLYTGVTANLVARVQEHRNRKYPKSFTARYNLTKLVFYEAYPRIEEAIQREKQIKGGSRKKKEKLIHQHNPDWRDLWEEVSKW